MFDTFNIKVLTYNRYKKRCANSFVEPIRDLLIHFENHLNDTSDINDGFATLNIDKLMGNLKAVDPNELFIRYALTNLAIYRSEDLTTKLHWMIIDFFDNCDNEKPVKWKFKDCIELLYDFEENAQAYKTDALTGIEEFVKSKYPLAIDAYNILGYSRLKKIKFSRKETERLLAQ